LACYRFVVIIKVIISTIKATDVANIQALSSVAIEYINKENANHINIAKN
jgi:hypothetical protein